MLVECEIVGSIVGENRSKHGRSEQKGKDKQNYEMKMVTLFESLNLASLKIILEIYRYFFFLKLL